MLLRAETVKKRFGKEEILKGISLDVKEKTFTVILGPSGSGKSTFLNTISGLIPPDEGKVWFREKEVTGMSEKERAQWKRKSVGYVFQEYLLLNNLTVRENIEIGRCPGQEAFELGELVRILEIDGLLDKFPGQLSGGQKQRTAIARAVIKKPEILFCDEATGALDEANSKKVVELLYELKQQFGIAVLFVTHNSQIAQTADRVITIKDGLLYKDMINENPIPAKEMIWE